MFWTPITAEQAAMHDDPGKNISRFWRKFKKFGRLTREDLQRLFMILTAMRIVSNARGQYERLPFRWRAIAHQPDRGFAMALVRSAKFVEYLRFLLPIRPDMPLVDLLHVFPFGSGAHVAPPRRARLHVLPG